MMRLLFGQTIFLVCLVLCTTIAHAQSIDEAKMKRDLEVAKNVLETLLKGDSDDMRFYGHDDINANYMDNYGVVFSLPNNSIYYIQRGRNRTTISQSGRGNSSTVIQYSEEDAESDADAEVIVESKGRRERYEGTVIETGMEAAVYTFFADYADLIGQLEPTDKILVSKSGSDNTYIWDNGSEIETNNGAISMEVKKSDITAYRSGKIDMEEFQSRVKVSRESDSKNNADLKMFASILKRYYSSDITETYFISREPSFEYLDGFGVIYNVKTFSSYQDGNRYRIPGTNDQGFNKQERNTVVADLYPKFVDDLKEFILDYGRTIRSLDGEEMLMMKIQMTRCEECGIPKTVEVSIKNDILMQYDKQKISKDKALNAISWKENMD